MADDGLSESPKMPGVDVTTDDASTAVVSLYNSWSSTSELGSIYDDDDTLQDDDRFAILPTLSDVSSAELLEQLQTRCSKDDIPKVAPLRRRRRPVCSFLNFMGERRSEEMNVEPVTSPMMPSSSSILDLGLAEKDALFPMYSGKAKHSNDYDAMDGPEMKRLKRDGGGDIPKRAC